MPAGNPADLLKSSQATESTMKMMAADKLVRDIRAAQWSEKISLDPWSHLDLDTRCEARLLLRSQALTFDGADGAEPGALFDTLVPDHGLDALAQAEPA